MRLPAAWTMLMAVVIAGYATLVSATILGGGGVAWALAIPVMFFGLQLLGLPLVMICEAGERFKMLPRGWRPVFDEMLIVGSLCAFGFWFLPEPVAIYAGAFFAGMYLLRLAAWQCWKPGEAEEVGS